MSWTHEPLADAPVEIIDGDRGKNYPSQNELLEEGHCLFLSATNVTKDGFVFEKCQFVTEQKNNALRKGQVRRNDIVLTTRGTLGNIAYYSGAVPFEHVRINSGMVTIQSDNEKLLPRYLYYFLKSELFQAQVRSLQSGAAQPQLPIRDIKKIKISYPDPIAQDRIADTVGTYDDLIENNRRRIALLEEAANLLYREWFVHFRFPGAEHVKIVDGVPEGWFKGTVQDLGHVITGKTPSTKNPENFGSDVPFIKTPDMHASSIVLIPDEYLSETGANSQRNKTLPPHSILVACIGARLGVVSLNAKACQTNQQINAVVPSEEYFRYYGYCALKGFREKLLAIGGGATMPNVNKTKFSSMELLIPNKAILEIFHSHVEQNFEQSAILIELNHRLTQARDLLLPRLMDGRLEI